MMQLLQGRGLLKKQKENLKRYLASTIRRQVEFLCGYVGHLYEGRGIEVIIELAQRLPDVGFFVVGGTETDIRKYKRLYDLNNLAFLGFMPHPRSFQSDEFGRFASNALPK